MVNYARSAYNRVVERLVFWAEYTYCGGRIVHKKVIYIVALWKQMYSLCVHQFILWYSVWSRTVFYVYDILGYWFWAYCSLMHWDAYAVIFLTNISKLWLSVLLLYCIFLYCTVAWVYCSGLPYLSSFCPYCICMEVENDLLPLYC